MSRVPVVDQRSNFIAEYAAKRQTQMERAKQLREQRTGSGGASSQRDQPPTPLSSHQSNTYDQQRASASSFDEMAARPQNVRAPPQASNNYPHAQHATAYEPQPQHRGAMDYPPPARQVQQQAPHTTLGKSTSTSSGALEVTEAHFREATQRGIITSDQARQLWAVLSDQAILVRGSDSYRSSGDQQQGGPRSGRQEQAQPQYNPSQYAAPAVAGGNRAGGGDKSNATYRGSYAHHLVNGQLDDDEEYPQMDYGQPSKVSKSLASRVANAKSSSKPEWNSDFAGGGYEEEAAPLREEAPPSRATKKSTNQRPEWNHDSAMNYTEPEPPIAPKAAHAKSTAVSRGGARRFDDEEDVVPLEKAVPSRKKPEQQHQRPQQTPNTNRYAPASRGGKMPPPPPEPTGPVEQDEEEVDEFLRQKEDAKRQFEEALADANRAEPLVPCNVCGRNFRASILSRHEKACKVAGKKRRVFDSKSNRLQGIDGIDEVLQQPPPRKAGGKAAPPSRGGGQAERQMPANAMPKWKLQHQQFQLALQAIKHAANPSSGGPPPPMPESLDDRVPCPHCSRRFARETAERHIPSCAKTINKPKGLVRPGGRR